MVSNGVIKGGVYEIMIHSRWRRFTRFVEILNQQLFRSTVSEEKDLTNIN